MRLFAYLALRNGPLSAQLLHEVRTSLASQRLAVSIENSAKHFAPFLTLDEKLPSALEFVEREFAVREAAPFLVVAKGEWVEMPFVDARTVASLFEKVERISIENGVPIALLPRSKALQLALSMKYGPKREEWPAVTLGRLKKGATAVTIYEDEVRMPGRWEKVKMIVAAEVRRIA
jgi:hypothetical protein